MWTFYLSRLKSGDLSLRVDPHIAVAATEIWNGEKVPVSVLLQAETKMLIADNMTIVIGGLMKEEEITRKRKFPLLGNIPMLGNIPIVGLVFRSKGRLMQKTETVIFLTVRTNAVDAPEDDNNARHDHQGFMIFRILIYFLMILTLHGCGGRPVVLAHLADGGTAAGCLRPLSCHLAVGRRHPGRHDGV